MWYTIIISLFDHSAVEFLAIYRPATEFTQNIAELQFILVPLKLPSTEVIISRFLHATCTTRIPSALKFRSVII